MSAVALNRFYVVYKVIKLLPFFFFNDTATTEIYTLSLHDALPISHRGGDRHARRRLGGPSDLRLRAGHQRRSEEHTSELQSPCNLVCRLLLEKKNTAVRPARRPRSPPRDQHHAAPADRARPHEPQR